MKQQLRPLHSERRYERKGDAELYHSWLLPILNGDLESGALITKPGAKRVVSLLTRFLALESVRNLLRLGLDRSNKYRVTDKPNWCNDPGFGWFYRVRHFDDPEMDELNKQAGALLWQTNTLLKRYKWSPFLEFNEDSDRLVDSQSTEESSSSEAEYTEKAAIWVFVKHVEAGTIQRFRQCEECSHWFYALADHQRFCGESCRKRFASNSDEYRANRAKYMRERYRPLQKKLNAASIARIHRKETR